MLEPRLAKKQRRRSRVKGTRPRKKDGLSDHAGVLISPAIWHVESRRQAGAG
jgi:hypothetical protein